MTPTGRRPLESKCRSILFPFHVSWGCLLSPGELLVEHLQEMLDEVNLSTVHFRCGSLGALQTCRHLFCQGGIHPIQGTVWTNQIASFVDSNLGFYPHSVLL